MCECVSIVFATPQLNSNYRLLSQFAFFAFQPFVRWFFSFSWPTSSQFFRFYFLFCFSILRVPFEVRGAVDVVAKMCARTEYSEWVQSWIQCVLHSIPLRPCHENVQRKPNVISTWTMGKCTWSLMMRQQTLLSPCADFVRMNIFFSRLLSALRLFIYSQVVYIFLHLLLFARCRCRCVDIVAVIYVIITTTRAYVYWYIYYTQSILVSYKHNCAQLLNKYKMRARARAAAAKHLTSSSWRWYFSSSSHHQYESVSNYVVLVYYCSRAEEAERKHTLLRQTEE